MSDSLDDDHQDDSNNDDRRHQSESESESQDDSDDDGENANERRGNTYDDNDDCTYMGTQRKGRDDVTFYNGDIGNRDNDSSSDNDSDNDSDSDDIQLRYQHSNSNYYFDKNGRSSQLKISSNNGTHNRNFSNQENLNKDTHHRTHRSSTITTTSRNRKEPYQRNGQYGREQEKEQVRVQEIGEYQSANGNKRRCEEETAISKNYKIKWMKRSQKNKKKKLNQSEENDIESHSSSERSLNHHISRDNHSARSHGSRDCPIQLD